MKTIAQNSPLQNNEILKARVDSRINDLQKESVILIKRWLDLVLKINLPNSEYEKQKLNDIYKYLEGLARRARAHNQKEGPYDL